MKYFFSITVLLLSTTLISARNPLTPVQDNLAKKKQKTWDSLGQSLSKSKTAFENAQAAYNSKDPQKMAKATEELAHLDQEVNRLAQEYARDAAEAQ